MFSGRRVLGLATVLTIGLPIAALLRIEQVWPLDLGWRLQLDPVVALRD